MQIYGNPIFILVVSVNIFGSICQILFFSFIFLIFIHKPIPFCTVVNEKSHNALLKQRDFIKVVYQLYDQMHHYTHNMHVICGEAAKQPAPQFYISPKQAMLKYYEYQREHHLSHTSNINRQMYLELFKRFEQIKPLHTELSNRAIMALAIEQPAPCFYINPDSAAFYFYKALKNKKRFKKTILYS